MSALFKPKGFQPLFGQTHSGCPALVEFEPKRRDESDGEIPERKRDTKNQQRPKTPETRNDGITTWTGIAVPMPQSFGSVPANARVYCAACGTRHKYSTAFFADQHTLGDSPAQKELHNKEGGEYKTKNDLWVGPRQMRKVFALATMAV